MDRIDLGGATGITVDACRYHGVWLDAGELEQLRRIARSGGALHLEAIQRAAAARRNPRLAAFGGDRWWVDAPSSFATDLTRSYADGLLWAILQLLHFW